MLLLKCVICSSKESRFTKNLKSLQKESGLLNSLDIKTALGKISLLGNILFQLP